MEKGIFELSRWGRTEFIAAAAVVWLTGLLLSWISKLTARRGRSYRLPPGPRGWPLLGAIPYLGTFPHRSFEELSKKYGPIMYMRLGAAPVLVISNREMAKEVLQTHDHVFSARPIMLVPRYITYDRHDIAWSNGPLWRQARKIATSQLMTASKLTRFSAILKDETLRTIHTALEQSQSSDGDGANVNMSAPVNGAMMNVMTQAMWNKTHRNSKGGGSSYRDRRFVEVIDMVMVLSGSDNIADFLPSCLQSLAMKLSGLDRKMRDVHNSLDEFCESIIIEKEEAMSKEAKGDDAAEEDDFVDVMLKLIREPGDDEGLSRETMKGILRDMILAGTDTTATTMDWILAELIKHPDIMKKLQDELAAVVGTDRLVSESDIPNLKYLNAVVKETLRKHCVAPLGIPHMSAADCQVAGYDVPANTMVFINQFAIHHDSLAWENPNEFNPDRFLESDLDFRGRHYEFLPFGSGRRMCPGITLASTFLHFAVAQFVHAVEWRLPEGQTSEEMDMSERQGITLARVIPLILTAKPRLAHNIIYPTDL